jgi:hypothetical protein
VNSEDATNIWRLFEVGRAWAAAARFSEAPYSEDVNRVVKVDSRCAYGSATPLDRACEPAAPASGVPAGCFQCAPTAAGVRRDVQNIGCAVTKSRYGWRAASARCPAPSSLGTSAMADRIRPGATLLLILPTGARRVDGQGNLGGS